MSDGFDPEAEVRDLAARRDIMAACQRYMRAQDRLLPDLHRSAFHEDAYVDCGLYAGPAHGFVDFAQGFLATMKGSQHIIGQHMIEIDGDAADGEVYFFAWHRPIENGEERDLFICGRYVDRYEKRNGEWRIADRRELIDWARSDPAADSFLKENAGKVLLGGYGEADLSYGRVRSA